MDFLIMYSWAGKVFRQVEIIGETPTKYRVKLLEDTRLPGGRFKLIGSTVTVPKHAVVRDVTPLVGGDE